MLKMRSSDWTWRAVGSCSAGVHWFWLGGMISSPRSTSPIDSPVEEQNSERFRELDAPVVGGGVGSRGVFVGGRVDVGVVSDAVSCLRVGASPGPDGVPTVAVQNFPVEALRALGNVIECSCLNTGRVPRAWRQAKVCPILKPGKELHAAKSYRPISLTSNVAKVGERVVGPG